MVLGKLPVLGRPRFCIIVGQGQNRGCLDNLTLLCPFSSLSHSLWETARYRLKCCLKGPLNLKESMNHPAALYNKPH